jgi:hypothetical protein
MTTRKGSARDAARRQALKAKAQRDEMRRVREAEIEAALAGYYLATSQAERIRDNARRRADAMLADGERQAAAPVADAVAAVRRLRDLAGGIAEVAQLCGLTQAAVRGMLTAPGNGSSGGTGNGSPAGSGAGAAAGGDRHDG